MVKLKELADGIYLLLDDCANSSGDEFFKGEILVKGNAI